MPRHDAADDAFRYAACCAMMLPRCRHAADDAFAAADMMMLMIATHVTTCATLPPCRLMIAAASATLESYAALFCHTRTWLTRCAICRRLRRYCLRYAADADDVAAPRAMLRYYLRCLTPPLPMPLFVRSMR